MAMYELKNSYPKLIVAASHAALSGDLAVLVLDLPASERSQRTTEDNAQTISDSDDSMDEEEAEDMERHDAPQDKNDDKSPRGPFVLRY